MIIHLEVGKLPFKIAGIPEQDLVEKVSADRSDQRATNGCDIGTCGGVLLSAMSRIRRFAPHTGVPRTADHGRCRGDGSVGVGAARRRSTAQGERRGHAGVSRWAGRHTIPVLWWPHQLSPDVEATTLDDTMCAPAAALSGTGAASTWDALRSALDDGCQSLDRRLDSLGRRHQSGRLREVNDLLNQRQKSRGSA